MAAKKNEQKDKSATPQAKLIKILIDGRTKITVKRRHNSTKKEDI